MKTRIAALALALMPTVLQAAPIDPGLWEVSSRNMQVDGQAMPDVQDMLASMPAEQRQLMEQMMRQRGVEIGGQGVRVCLTPEQVQADQLPLQDPDSGCRQEITGRTGNQWTFRFSCPDAQGEGTAHFLSAREFTTQVKSTFKAGGVAQQGSLETHARWLQSDCGNIGPLR